MGSLSASQSSDPSLSSKQTLIDPNDLLNLFKSQQKYLNFFFQNLDLSQTLAFTQTLLNSHGTIFFSSVGKSGFVARKISQNPSLPRNPIWVSLPSMPFMATSAFSPTPIFNTRNVQQERKHRRALAARAVCQGQRCVLDLCDFHGVELLDGFVRFEYCHSDGFWGHCGNCPDGCKEFD
ncbi:hypothetical protein CsSME_00000314 [Camellia sinensis var. sinensis]